MVDFIPHGHRPAGLGERLAESLEIMRAKVIDAPVAPQVADQNLARAKVILKRPRTQLAGIELRFLAGQERVTEQANGAAVAGVNRRRGATVF
jgi:hypothetical protein